MIFNKLSLLICTLSLVMFSGHTSNTKTGGAICEKPFPIPRAEKHYNSSIISKISSVLQLKFSVKNSTAVVVFLDHGWVHVDWNFYEKRFVLLCKRIFAGGKYSNVILSPNYHGFDPYRSISEIFLSTISSANGNRSASHQSKMKVWLHLRSKAQFQLHDEKLVIPLLTNPLYSNTLTGLLIEAGTLDTRKEWNWQGIEYYRKAVQSIRKTVKVKLALLVDRYSCSYLPMRVPQQIFDNFDQVYYYDYEKSELEAAMMHIQHSKYVADQKRVTMSRLMFQDCRRWFTAIVRGKGVKPIRGVFHGVENEEFFNFTEIQLFM